MIFFDIIFLELLSRTSSRGRQRPWRSKCKVATYSLSKLLEGGNVFLKYLGKTGFLKIQE